MVKNIPPAITILSPCSCFTDYMNVTLRRASVQIRELRELPVPRQPRTPLVSRVLQVIRLNNSFVIS